MSPGDKEFMPTIEESPLLPGEDRPSIDPKIEELLSPQGEALLMSMSDAYARADGFVVRFGVDKRPNSTFSTSCAYDETGAIEVRLSPALLKRAETEDVLDLLCFAVLHELGHVRRFQAQPPTEKTSRKDGYFTNIVDDIAINYENAKRTRLIHDVTKDVYDKYLFPPEVRPQLARAPRHQQFMEGLLVLAMTTDAHARTDARELLQEAHLTDFDEEVVAAIGDVLDNQQGKTSFNLLQQLREYGDDLPYAGQVNSIIRKHYDALYDEDVMEQEQQTAGDDKGEGQPSDGQSDSDDDSGDPFDYSNSAGCDHTIEVVEVLPVEEDPEADDQVTVPDPEETDPEESSGSEGEETGDEDPEDDNDVNTGGGDENTDEGDPKPEDNPESGDDETGGTLDIQSIVKDISGKVTAILPDAAEASKDRPQQLTPEQLAQLRKELKLSEADFADYMATRQQYAAEIQAIQDMLLQLRRERQNEFLAPGREVAARGHRLRVDKLVRAVASDTLGDQPNIWKHPSMAERIEHEFDGLDFILLCDVSDSMNMHGKAQAAAGSAVVMQEGLLGASSQMAAEHTPVVRLQIDAFGAGYEVVCELTDTPSMRDLGRTYTSLKNPTSRRTEVAGSLEAIKPEPGRLTVVAVVSDGEFHDKAAATQAGQALAAQGVAIIQMVFGGAAVSQLSDTAHVASIATASDLPEQLFILLPELIELLRQQTQQPQY